MNPETGKHAGGRPLKFQSVAEFDKRVDAYFDQADFPTITGLAVFLDTSRRTLLDYSEKDEFTHSIKRALDMCEAQVETRAMSGKANPVMSIFTLKNNYGWRDKTEIDQTVVADVTSNGETLASKSDVDQMMDVLKAKTGESADS